MSERGKPRHHPLMLLKFAPSSPQHSAVSGSGDSHGGARDFPRRGRERQETASLAPRAVEQDSGHQQKLRNRGCETAQHCCWCVSCYFALVLATLNACGWPPLARVRKGAFGRRQTPCFAFTYTIPPPPPPPAAAATAKPTIVLYTHPGATRQASTRIPLRWPRKG